MPDLSEFIEFVAEKSKIRKLSLIEKDILLHKILKGICSSGLGNNYLFKGGSCLVKCYLGYYRLSIDLDFTWKNQEVWEKLGEKKLRRKLKTEIRNFGSLLENVAKQIGLEFVNNLENKKYFEFGGGGRSVTFKLWKASELIKLQVTFVERILFKPKIVEAKTLLANVELTDDERAYFQDFLEFYKPLKLLAYDEREIFCEKIRAILTRRSQKLRDFYDVFKLHEQGVKLEELKNEIVEKIKAALYYKKYRENLERNRKELEIGREILEDPFERELFIDRPPKEFDEFLRQFVKILREIAKHEDIIDITQVSTILLHVISPV